MKTVRAKAPVFVIGCSRSGTTLLYHMLLSSGNFAIYRMESQIFNLFEPRFRPLHKLKNKRRALDAWYGTRLYTRSGLEPAEIESRLLAECQNGGDFLRIIMEAMCHKQGVERWAETTPEHLLYIRRIKETIPDALIVHVIRDGRDVALSWEKLSQIRRFPWDKKRVAVAAAIYWEWIVGKGREAGSRFNGEYLEVRYEDLIREPATVLKNLEPFIEHELNYAQIQRAGIGSVSKPNTAFPGDQRSPVGRWMTDFSHDDLAALETLVGPTLQRLGYELGTNPADNMGLRDMKSVYRAYFEGKQFLKTRTPAGKWFVTRNLSWL